MKRLYLTLIAVVAAGSLVAGVTSAVAASPSKGAQAKVAVAASKLGRILVDGRGHTLYLFEKDKNGRSSCAGACAGFWPPLITAGRPLALKGAKASLLGTTRRSDGRLQVTYNHHPLYSFVKDTRKGLTKGEGLTVYGGEWYAVSATGTTVEKPASSSSADDSGSSGAYGSSGGYSSSGGYGY
jgi:predicted lipoprotein with Yx(FWY)xxD motif